jgi:hypothetical protein
MSHYSTIENSDLLPEFGTMSRLTFSVVPAGLLNDGYEPRTASWAKFSRPYGTHFAIDRFSRTLSSSCS